MDKTYKSKRVVLWLGLVLIAALTILSIYGAFVGAARARSFFNSVPLILYWFVFLIVLVLGIGVFPRLVRTPSLLLIHAGCVVVLVGSMWASHRGHAIRNELLGTDKIPQGSMQIYEGGSEKHVVLDGTGEIKELPFSIRLKDFGIEYYQPGYLIVQSRNGKTWRIPAKVGTRLQLAPDLMTVEIVRKFENFKITLEQGKHQVIDQPGGGSNPALEIRVDHSSGSAATRYVFERFAGHPHPGDEFQFIYQRMAREYTSRVEVLRDGRVVAQKNIEVNHPLHYAGYHFYQNSYGSEAGWYTVLGVVSDRGLYIVYAGYAMLCVGVFWLLWFRELLSAKHRVTNR